MNQHNEANVEDHLEMVWAAFGKMKKELDSLKDLRQKFDESEENNQMMKKSLAVYQAEFSGLAQAIQYLKQADIEQKNMMKEMKKKTAEDMAKLARKVQPPEKRSLPCQRYGKITFSGSHRHNRESLPSPMIHREHTLE